MYLVDLDLGQMYLVDLGQLYLVGLTSTTNVVIRLWGLAFSLSSAHGSVHGLATFFHVFLFEGQLLHATSLQDVFDCLTHKNPAVIAIGLDWHLGVFYRFDYVAR